MSTALKGHSFTLSTARSLLPCVPLHGRRQPVDIFRLNKALQESPGNLIHTLQKHEQCQHASPPWKHGRRWSSAGCGERGSGLTQGSVGPLHAAPAPQPWVGETLPSTASLTPHSTFYQRTEPHQPPQVLTQLYSAAFIPDIRAPLSSLSLGQPCSAQFWAPPRPSNSGLHSLPTDDKPEPSAGLPRHFRPWARPPCGRRGQQPHHRTPPPATPAV